MTFIIYNYNLHLQNVYIVNILQFVFCVFVVWATAVGVINVIFFW